MKPNTFTALCANSRKRKYYPFCKQTLTLKGGDWGVWLTDLNHPDEHVVRELAYLREVVAKNEVICHHCWLWENGNDEEDFDLYPDPDTAGQHEHEPAPAYDSEKPLRLAEGWQA